MIRTETTTVTETNTYCDVTGRDLEESGWAIIRRVDGVEVAHFGRLDQLRPELEKAAWKTINNKDGL